MRAPHARRPTRGRALAPARAPRVANHAIAGGRAEPAAATTPRLEREQLVEYLAKGCKPRSQWRYRPQLARTTFISLVLLPRASRARCRGLCGRHAAGRLRAAADLWWHGTRSGESGLGSAAEAAIASTGMRYMRSGNSLLQRVGMPVASAPCQRLRSAVAAARELAPLLRGHATGCDRARQRGRDESSREPRAREPCLLARLAPCLSSPRGRRVACAFR